MMKVKSNWLVLLLFSLSCVVVVVDLLRVVIANYHGRHCGLVGIVNCMWVVIVLKCTFQLKADSIANSSPQLLQILGSIKSTIDFVHGLYESKTIAPVNM